MSLNWWKSRPRLGEAPVPEEDPIVTSSLATPIAITSLLLVLTLIWAFYDEASGLRPWIGYQERFVGLYREALQDLKPERAAEEEAIHASEGYQELKASLEQNEADLKGQLSEIGTEEQQVRSSLDAITKSFASIRSQVQAKMYELETASEGDKAGFQEELDEFLAGPYAVQLPSPGGSGGAEEPRQLTFEEFEELFSSLKAQQGRIGARKVGLARRPGQLRQELGAYVEGRLTGPNEIQISRLISSLDQYRVEIKQIHSPEMGLVDRCQSCHAGALEPVALTPENMGGEKVFASHPNSSLLGIHDTEVFGCSPCHNGNGIGTVSVVKAHGTYKHWLYPLYPPENFEAGCLQCHEADRRLDHAPVLSAGKQLFFQRGCWGCHAREGYDLEASEFRELQKTIADLTNGRIDTQLEIERTVARADESETNEEAARLYAEAVKRTLSIADIDTQLARDRVRADELLMEAKKVAPNLKEVKSKLRRDWLPAWIKNPQGFRPTTKMPQFRLDDEQVQAISAFIWQSGVDSRLEEQAPGDAESGKELFETRGCMACHSIGEGEEQIGGTFAANLSRVGEKVSYDYLVGWVHNPRERTLPYCPIHQRDITPEDYAEHGLPFEFGLDNKRCPLGDHSLQVQNQTLMPILRLTPEESRDVASYLMTLKKEDADYPPVAELDDPALAQKGRFLVRHFGCAGCHEIAGLENEAKIGTNLTREGSKPIERLDFALLTEEAKEEGWYNHKGFFERKLADPAIYDQGKIKKSLEKLRMPDFHLSEEQITQASTFLQGSVDQRFPEKFHYRPRDHRKDIQEGWEVVMKYNCVACHQLSPGQDTILQQLPIYQTDDGKERLPPPLVGEGARVDPMWLAGFLSNPALDENDHRNGVRRYLQVRMPTFNLSSGEVQKLVRFFSASSRQALPYMLPDLEPLSAPELSMARQLFTHPAAPCLRCHATGDPKADQTATAPSFALTRERLKPDWTRRWLVHPEIIQPGTSMPSGLFEWDGKRWIFALADLPSMKDYPKDHADLVVRYMFQFTAEEQRRLK